MFFFEMMNRLLRVQLQLMLTCFLFGLPMAVRAQTIPVTTYTSEHGLPPYGVWGICQDQQGVMWFACTSGLARYDGVEFQLFDTAHGIANQSLRCIIEDSDGMIWIGTEESVTRFDGRAFENFGVAQGLGKGTVWALLADERRNIWCGTRTGGLNRISETGMITQFDTSHGLPSNFIYTVFLDSRKRLWLGTESEGVLHVEIKENRLRVARRFLDEHGLPDPKVHAIVEDRTGNLIFGTYGGGIAVWDGSSDTLRIINEADGLAGNDVYALLIKRNGELVVGTLDGGITIMDPDTFGSKRCYAKKNGLLSDGVYALFEDQEGSIWVGHGHGVSKIITENFQRYSIAEGLVAESVYSVLADGPNDVWVAANGGISHLNKRDDAQRFSITESFKMTEGLPSDEVWSILRDRRGNLWFGTAKGVCQLAPNKKFRVFTQKDGLVRDYVISIMEDREGLIWFGTPLGISHYDYETGQFGRITVDDGYCGGPVHSLAQDGWGRLWFGTYGQGIDVFENGKIHHYGPENGLPSNSIITVYKDRSGAIWVGTGGAGLFLTRFSSEGQILGFDSVGEPFGIDAKTIVTLREDAAGQFWVGSQDGVYVLDHSRVRIEAPQNAVLRFLDKKSGLVGNQTTTSGCFSEASDGSMWIGMNGGIVRCLSPGVEEIGKQPNVIIHSVYVEGAFSLYAPFSTTAGQLGEKNRFLDERPSTFAHNQNNLRFSYAAPSFRDESGVAYQYRLIGFDTPEQGWSRGTSIHFKEYTNLNPGDYAFMVRAKTRDGVWSDAPAQFTFSIARAWWQTAWFKALCVLVLVSAVYGFIKFRLYSLEKRRKILEDQVQMRTKELVQTADRLKAAQQDLLEAAHVAGRAEIATTVLHNVGNTVNSVKVSAEVLETAVQDAHVIKFIDRMVTELKRHRDDLATFLTHDPVGKQFPDTLDSLLSKFKMRNESLMGEITNLRDHIDRLQYFLQAQYKHAEGSAFWESVDLKQFIIQLMDVQADTLKALRIDVSLTLQDVPRVAVQKSKLVAVFIKLLDNACQSLNAVPPDREKWITVALRQENGSHIVVEVRDNGVGIPQEELADLFQQVHAKKQAFSLHFCANAIAEMGGTINAKSDGTGHGATFILTLPIKREPSV